MGAESSHVVTLHGKGSSLTSSSVFEIANRLTDLTVDSSTLAKLSSSPNSKTSKPSVPTESASNLVREEASILAPEEARASLVVLLKKLLLSSSSTSEDVDGLSDMIQEYISSSKLQIPLNHIIDGASPVDFSVAAMAGISGLLDHRAAALSVIIDAVAALSCEALGANILAFDLIDGSSAKDVVSVAANLKILLNGSKLVNREEIDEPAVSGVPVVHGKLRETCRLLQSNTHVQLNSAFVSNSGFSWTASSMCPTLFSLAATLQDLGNLSYSRAKHILDSCNAGDVFHEKCPRPDQLEDLFMSLPASFSKKEYVKFSHDVNSLLDMVEQIVFWEVMAAYFFLEGKDLIGENRTLFVKEDSAETDKERGKKIMGKGTTAIGQFLRDRLPIKTETVEGFEDSVLHFLMMLVDPKRYVFDTLLTEVKDIVESNGGPKTLFMEDYDIVGHLRGQMYEGTYTKLGRTRPASILKCKNIEEAFAVYDNCDDHKSHPNIAKCYTILADKAVEDGYVVVLEPFYKFTDGLKELYNDKTFWRYSKDEKECLGFGEGFKDIFRQLASGLLEINENDLFSNNLIINEEESVLLEDQCDGLWFSKDLKPRIC